MKLIGIMGAAGSGKDAVAGFLRAQGWASVAFADPLPDSVLLNSGTLEDLEALVQEHLG
jgi:hypothetical protein